jgi:hypothetical protein
MELGILKPKEVSSILYFYVHPPSTHILERSRFMIHPDVVLGMIVTSLT